MPGPLSGNPITPQSVVVLNATYDRYYSNFRKRAANLIHVGGSNEDADYDIFPREARTSHILPTARPPPHGGVLLLTKTPPQVALMLRQDYDSAIRRPVRGYEVEREIRVFTSANRLPWLWDSKVH